MHSGNENISSSNIDEQSIKSTKILKHASRNVVARRNRKLEQYIARDIVVHTQTPDECEIFCCNSFDYWGTKLSAGTKRLRDSVNTAMFETEKVNNDFTFEKRNSEANNKTQEVQW